MTTYSMSLNVQGAEASQIVAAFGMTEQSRGDSFVKVQRNDNALSVMVTGKRGFVELTAEDDGALRLINTAFKLGCQEVKIISPVGAVFVSQQNYNITSGPYGQAFGGYVGGATAADVRAEVREIAATVIPIAVSVTDPAVPKHEKPAAALHKIKYE